MTLIRISQKEKINDYTSALPLYLSISYHITMPSVGIPACQCSRIVPNIYSHFYILAEKAASRPFRSLRLQGNPGCTAKWGRAKKVLPCLKSTCPKCKCSKVSQGQKSKRQMSKGQMSKEQMSKEQMFKEQMSERLFKMFNWTTF